MNICKILILIIQWFPKEELGEMESMDTLLGVMYSYCLSVCTPM